MWPFDRNRAHRIRSSSPYWLWRDGAGDARASLAQSVDCDIAIVGAGITGALIADALVETRRRIVMLDSRDVALGSTAATTALLQYEIDTHLTDLVRMIGPERAITAYRACVASFALLEDRFPELLPLSNYQRRESLYLAENERALPALRSELQARGDIGISCRWLDREEVESRHGCRRPGAILSSLGAQLDPVRFTQALIAGVERHGVNVFARTSVKSIEESGARLSLTTAQGHRVTAEYIVVAAGFESVDFLRGKFADIANTYALVTEPFEDSRRIATMPLIWETARPYLYLRGTPDGRLIVGGADLPFKNAHARDVLLGRQVQRLAQGYRELFGDELPSISQAWGGSFASTAGGLPLIGPAPGMHPRLLFALCYGGNGITYSVHAGGMIRARIESRAHELEDVFGFPKEGADLAAGAGGVMGAV